MIDHELAQQLIREIVVVVSKEYSDVDESNDAILETYREMKSQYGNDLLNQIEMSLTHSQEETND